MSFLQYLTSSNFYVETFLQFLALTTYFSLLFATLNLFNFYADPFDFFFET